MSLDDEDRQREERIRVLAWRLQIAATIEERKRIWDQMQAETKARSERWIRKLAGTEGLPE